MMFDMRRARSRSAEFAGRVALSDFVNPKRSQA
jgi:hypothetical protein